MLALVLAHSLAVSALDPDAACESVVRRNTEFYDRVARDYEITHQHVSPNLERLRELFVERVREVAQLPENIQQHRMRSRPRVLDLGSGHGRDSYYFRQQDLDVYAMDASYEMVKITSKYLERPAFHLTAEEMSFDQAFHGIWASASLLHVPADSLPSVFRRIARALKPKGYLFASFTKGIGTPDRGEFIPDGRYFSRVSEAQLRKIVAEIPELEIVEPLTFTNDDDFHGTNRPSPGFGFFNLTLQKR